MHAGVWVSQRRKSDALHQVLEAKLWSAKSVSAFNTEPVSQPLFEMLAGIVVVRI